jgi:hypothetical protein
VETSSRPCSFWVGVTGHRRIAPEHLPHVTARVRAALGAVAAAATGAAAPQAPALAVVSPLAGGADQLVARLALEQGYGLQVPLPLPRDDYRRDLEERGDEVEGLDDLLAQAAAVIELDGSFDARPDAYRRVGRVVLEHADLLLALWDGVPARGVGGTGEVVRAARERGIPTLVVSTAADVQPVLEGATSLDAVVRRTIAPFASGEPSAAGLRHATTQCRRLEAFAGEAARQRTWRWRCGAVAGRLWPWFAGIRRRTASPPEAGAGVALPAPLVALGEHVGSLARHYANLYRSAFLANYVLGALAVGLALAGGIALVRGLLEGHGGHGSPWGVVFAVAELVSLLAMVAIWQVGRRGRWHEKAIDYRTLAEQLRCLRLRWPLGLAPARPHVRPHTTPESDLSAHWTQQVVREVARGAGLPRVAFTNAYRAVVAAALDGTVREQATYHRDIATHYGRLHHRLERLALLFALGALVPCLLHLVWHDPWAAAWLVALAAGLPAVAAALHGIDGQAELERIAKRSAAMAQWLGAGATAADVPAGEDLVSRTEALVDRLIDETNDWQVLSRAGGLKAT